MDGGDAWTKAHTSVHHLSWGRLVKATRSSLGEGSICSRRKREHIAIMHSSEARDVSFCAALQDVLVHYLKHSDCVLGTIETSDESNRHGRTSTNAVAMYRVENFPQLLPEKLGSSKVFCAVGG